MGQTRLIPPIAVDQKDRSGRVSRYKSMNFPFWEVSYWRPLTEGLFWRFSWPPFLLSSSARPSLVVLVNYRMSKQPAFVRLFLHTKVFGELGSGKWEMVFPLLHRQSGGKCQECSQSPVRTGITAERFYPDFENKILATRVEGLGGIVVLFLAGWPWIVVYLKQKEKLINNYPLFNNWYRGRLWGASSSRS